LCRVVSRRAERLVLAEHELRTGGALQGGAPGGGDMSDSVLSFLLGCIAMRDTRDAVCEAQRLLPEAFTAGGHGCGWGLPGSPGPASPLAASLSAMGSLIPSSLLPPPVPVGGQANVGTSTSTGTGLGGWDALEEEGLAPKPGYPPRRPSARLGGSISGQDRRLSWRAGGDRLAVPSARQGSQVQWSGFGGASEFFGGGVFGLGLSSIQKGGGSGAAFNPAAAAAQDDTALAMRVVQMTRQRIASTHPVGPFQRQRMASANPTD